MVVLAQVGWLISRDMGFSLGSDHFSDAIANCVWALYTLYLYISNDLESGRKKNIQYRKFKTATSFSQDTENQTH
jgi:hypothetical protein